MSSQAKREDIGFLTFSFYKVTGPCAGLLAAGHFEGELFIDKPMFHEQIMRGSAVYCTPSIAAQEGELVHLSHLILARGQ